MSGNYHIDLDRGLRRIETYIVVEPRSIKPRGIKSHIYNPKPTKAHKRRIAGVQAISAQRERLARIAAELKL
jgi:hypothetical protein